MIYSGTLPSLPTAHQVTAFVNENQSRSQRLHLSGLMVLMRLDFLQIIEGPNAALDRLYEQLSGDTQRYRLVLVMRHEIGEPLFAQWPFALIQLPPPGLEPSEDAKLQLGKIQQLHAHNELERYTLRVVQEFISGKWHRHHVDPLNPEVVKRPQS